MWKWTPQHWNLVRGRGRKHYILTHCVPDAVLTALVFWGIFLLLIPVFYERRITPNTEYFASGDFWALTLGAAVLFPLVGYLRGAWDWRRYERRFARLEPHDEGDAAM